MRALFEAGLRLLGAAVLCWAIEPLANLATVLSLPSIPRSGQLMLIHTLVSAGLNLLIGLWLLLWPGPLCRLVADREEMPAPHALFSARSLLQLGLMLIGFFYLLPAIKDLSIGISELVRQAPTQAERLTGREFVRGIAGAVVSLLLIVRSRHLALWGSSEALAPATPSPSGSGQRPRRG